MKRIVMDIETVGFDFDTLSESQQEYMLRATEKETDPEQRLLKTEEAKRWLSLYPLTAKVVVIAFYNVESGNSLILFEGEKKDEWETGAEGTKRIFKAGTEAEILREFWNYAAKIDQLITFNGRGFDVPFLMIRSAMLKIKATRNFMGYRYDMKSHLDLLEAFSYFGGFKKFNLDFYCHSFGIESPKSKGVSGMDVKELYEAGKIKEVAKYCSDDIKATYELYKIWNEYLNV